MEDLKSHLSFRIGTELYAANASVIHNIIEIPKITEMPETPKFMLGVANLKGIVLPVIDSRIKFGIKEIAITSESCIIIMEVNIDEKKTFVGLLVDAVSEVIEVEKEDIKNPPSISLTKNNEYISGIIENQDKFIIIIDINKVFSIEDVLSLEMN